MGSYGLVIIASAAIVGIITWFLFTKTVVKVAKSRGSELPASTLWLASLFMTPLGATLLAILSVSGSSVAQLAREREAATSLVTQTAILDRIAEMQKHQDNMLDGITEMMLAKEMGLGIESVGKEERDVD